MERSILRRRLRRMHGILLDSCKALDRASTLVSNKRLRDLLEMLASRRVIMLGLLREELGSSMLKIRPSEGADERFLSLVQRNRSDVAVASVIMGALEQEEKNMIADLDDLVFSPNLTDRNRAMLMEMLTAAEQDLEEMGFLRSSLLLARA